MDQMTMFEYLYPAFKIDKPIRLIELFSGVSSQAMALRDLGAEFEHYLTREWEVNAVASCKAIHFGDDDTDYSAEYTEEELVDILFEMGISTNGKNALTKEQINKHQNRSRWLRKTYNDIKATHNLVNIMAVKGNDLGIVDTDKYIYLLTYSFPCQDLSLAGKRKGMSKGAGTRIYGGISMSIRPYIDNKKLSIDGRMIPYPLVTAGDYFEARHNMTQDEVDKFVDEHYEQYTMLNTIIAMKQSCFLLRNVSYSCGSLSDNLYAHKNDMVGKYNETYDVPFDEDFYENYSKTLSKVVAHIKDLDLSNLKIPIGVIYDKPLDYPDKFVIRIFDGSAATNTIILRENLEECRKECIDGGFNTIIPRAMDDDYCIVESWM